MKLYIYTLCLVRCLELPFLDHLSLCLTSRLQRYGQRSFMDEKKPTTNFAAKYKISRINKKKVG